ncbi:MAG: endonuclease/exonuclease/phosphatase family protein [Cellvibrio sp.]
MSSTGNNLNFSGVTSSVPEEITQVNFEAPAVSKVRILTLNMHKGFTFFNRRFILPELRDAVHALSTDIVFLQEVHGTHREHAERFSNWPKVSQYEFLADSMWPEYSYGRNAVYPHGDHGNALLSKYPITRYQNLDVSIGKIEQRGLLYSLLKLPDDKQLHAICVHLGLRENHRRQQLKLLCDLVESLPEKEAVIIAGDFNDWRVRANTILAKVGFHEAFLNAFGKSAKSFPARWPLLSLDRVYIRNATSKNPEVLHNLPWSHLSDHAPLSVEVHI